MDKNKLTWTTHDELLYLDMIGLAADQTRKISKQTLLENYLAAALRRQRWGGVDKKAVLMTVKAELKVAR